MRIVIATMQFARSYNQGTERYVHLLASGLTQRGHDVIVLGGDPEQRGSVQHLGETVTTETPQPYRILHLPSRGWLSVRGAPADAYRNLLDELSPDVVHVANGAHIGLGLLEAAQQCQLPTLITTMDFWWICPKHTLLRPDHTTCDANVTARDCLRCIAATDTRKIVPTLANLPIIGPEITFALYAGRSFGRGAALSDALRWRARQAYIERVLSQLDAAIFPSQATRAAIEPRLPAGTGVVVPYGLESRWFDAAAGRPQPQPADPTSRTLGYAGALAPHKGPHLILEALHKLGWSRTRVRIAGPAQDERYVAHMKTLANGLNVEFVGNLPTEQIPDYFASLDLLVMTSLWPENLPIVVLEALATGTPVMSSRIAGVQELIDDPAWLFEINDANSLAQQLDAWNQNPQPAPSAMISTADEMTERTAKLYERAMAPS